MNNGKNASLFLTEMIVSLLFFSVSGAVILRVFAAAHVRAGENAARESAILCAQNIAEAYSVYGSVEEACLKVFKNEPQTDGQALVVGLNESCEPSESSVVTLYMTEYGEPTSAGELRRLSMTFSTESGELYSLECSAYVPEKGGAAND